MTTKTNNYYVSTPIYYVNDRPHIGHIYTTVVADVLARYHRMAGDEVFFLTGVDEHAAKVSDAAAEHDMTPQQWADQNAAEFKRVFQWLEMTNDDFIRTSEERHKSRVTRYVSELMDSGDVYPGEYEGWYDAGQEEYVPENKAKDYDYKSPVNGKPLVRKAEKNYFFKLSNYGDQLLELMEDHPQFVQPDARRNEMIGRLREGLNDVPVSRSGTGGWGIPIPGDDSQSIYVWIDALSNYLTTVDTDERRHHWPATVHLVAKDILWFHTVIWPAMLMALSKRPGYEWVKLPKQVYVHSYWISEGTKMSKSLGNFIDLEKIEHYVNTFSRDALRFFLATNGPLGATDSDFADAKFIDVYNADLANTLGNCSSRISNMTKRYFGGKLPAAGPAVEVDGDYSHAAEQCVARYQSAMAKTDLHGAAEAALDLVRSIDSYIEQTKPFKLAKEEGKLPEVGTILYNCAEAMRIASVMFWPLIPDKIEELWDRFGCKDYAAALSNKGNGDLAEWVKWGQLKPGTEIVHGDPLFPRHQVKK